MTMARPRRRGPAAFPVNDPTLSVERPETVEPPTSEAVAPPARVPNVPRLRRGMRWGAVLLSALGGLITLAAGLWIVDLARNLLARQDLIGWLAVGLLALAGMALVMLTAREAWALARVARLGRTRADAESALRQPDTARAAAAIDSLRRLYSHRPDLGWGLARLAQHQDDIMDAREMLTLAERELVAPLDGQARAIVMASARRVSVLTAVSPAALIDMAFVAAENLRMLRRLATLYGARPGALGLMRLARMVIAHIVVTGGIAVGDDIIHQFIGQGLTARLSARLGEGVFNGALTARIGIAAIDVCRPLPFIEARRPRFRDLVAGIAGLIGGEARGLN